MDPHQSIAPSSDILVKVKGDYRIVKLYSYIVSRDFGFAPNPFYGFCTLATCKPRIRKTATVGDWIIGTGSKLNRRDGHLVYAMRVTETMSFDEYWNDPRFRNKRPNMHASKKKAYGDNIYYKDPVSNEWCQMDSHHSYSDGSPNYNNVFHDTQADQVLVSDEFIYWGASGPKLPVLCGVDFCCSGQGHRCKFPDEAVAELIAWIRSVNDKGYCDRPSDWQ